MPMPDTLPDLAIAGYVHQGNSVCKCGMKMEWFQTPRGKRMPFSLKKDGSGKYEAHFGSCSFSGQFSKKAKK